ncbi:MAG: class I SAM-dependent methyltransferase, partial [Lachnospiraceae bacterium]|nr:class I SAM-dependent methyltransferase [Lachnospiraceae bacterium]
RQSSVDLLSDKVIFILKNTEATMLDKKGFDLWTDGYDKTVGISDEENTYPFAGYKDVLGNIFQIIMEKQNATVLDIGFGTGTLTTKLYEHGCDIYGQDFSSRMIALAFEKMPGSHLYQGDFTRGLAVPLWNQDYDFILFQQEDSDL